MICFQSAQHHAPNCKVLGVFQITHTPNSPSAAFSKPLLKSLEAESIF